LRPPAVRAHCRLSTPSSTCVLCQPFRHIRPDAADGRPVTG
jgi:hypothetical protein